MLHIATVHFKSPRWIPIQARELRRHLGIEHRVWTIMEGIDSSFGEYFHRVIDTETAEPGDRRSAADHARKLNLLGAEICAEADEEDLLMFLDGDAFPIANPAPLIAAALERSPLLAVRRDENCGDPQPHPSFCVTRVGTWRSLPGDWSDGYCWTGPRDQPTTDVGAELMHRLERSGEPWMPVLRTNLRNPHPVFFGVYGDVIYHHGAGFRFALCRADYAHIDPKQPENREELREIMERNRDISEAVFRRIEGDETGWLAEFV